MSKWFYLKCDRCFDSIADDDLIQTSQRLGNLKTVTLGLYSLSGRTSYPKISRSIAFPIALKFHGHLGSTAAEMPVKLQSEPTIKTPNLAASSLRDVARFGGKTPYRLVNRDPRVIGSQYRGQNHENKGVPFIVTLT